MSDNANGSAPVSDKMSDNGKVSDKMSDKNSRDAVRFIVKTVCERRDIEGLYAAYLAGKHSVRVLLRILFVTLTVIAVLFWAFAILLFVVSFIGDHFQMSPTDLSLILFFAAIGFLFYSRGNVRFRSRAAWRSYPAKGEELTFSFYDDDFSIEQKHSVTKTSYTGVVRLYEDKERYYLFMTRKAANILPKRDFEPGTAASFGEFIAAVTGLHIERG
jgi:hypothetical protein